MVIKVTGTLQKWGPAEFTVTGIQFEPEKPAPAATGITIDDALVEIVRLLEDITGFAVNNYDRNAIRIVLERINS